MRHSCLFGRLDVVIAQDRDDRYSHGAELARQHERFFREAVVREVAGDQQQIRGFSDPGEQGLERTLRRLGAVKVRDERNANCAHAKAPMSKLTAWTQ